MPVIQTVNVTKSFGESSVRVDALGGINLEIASGEMVAIVGPSGSGKSTLLNLLGAIDSPTSGSVILEGKDIATMDDRDRTKLRRRRIGFIFQAYNLIPTLTAVENVSLPLELDGVSESAARQRASRSLQAIGMDHRRDHLPSMMSGGEQQRVAIARALVSEPAFLMADEPTGNLDTNSSSQVATLLRDLVDQQSQTVVMVTHDHELAGRAHRIIRLCDGRIEGEERSHVRLTAPNAGDVKLTDAE